MSKRIALLADIHGNLLAFDAVLTRLRREQIDEIWILGDVVGFGSRPVECLDLLGTWAGPVKVIRGHTERLLCDDAWHDPATFHRSPPFPGVPEASASLGWTAERLTPEHQSLIRSWPATIDVPVEGRTIRLLHGSAGGPEAGIPQLLPGDDLAAMVGEGTNLLVATGHVHVPFFRELDTGLKLINPGAVSLSLDEDPRPSWAVIEVSSSRLAITFQRIDYPVDQSIADSAALQVPWHEFTSWILRKGKLPKVPPASVVTAAPDPHAPAPGPDGQPAVKG